MSVQRPMKAALYPPGLNCLSKVRTTTSHFVCLSVSLSVSVTTRYVIYVAAKATYIRLLYGKRVFFGPSSVKMGRTI